MSERVDLVSTKPHGYIFAIITIAMIAIVLSIAIPAILLFMAYEHSNDAASGGFCFLAFIGLIALCGAFCAVYSVVEHGLNKI